MYSAFAEVYDALMAEVDYAAWAGLYAQLLADRGVHNGASVCECACGTGSLTLPLQKAGYRMTGVDLSPDMLQRAGEKARREGLNIPFACQDMRALALHRPQDAILATCDGVNYLLTEDDLNAFLRAAAAALKPGGCLAFDVSTPHKLKNDLGNQLLCTDSEAATVVWQNAWLPRQRQVKMDLCIFVPERDGRYRRIDESQRQRAWELPELEAALRSAGFADVAVYGEKGLTPPAPSERRWHISAVRASAEG
ncbi:MAG: class I SAM-dependent methyltransferase [Clostridia bacterium]|nr:class I SAM-dependent methyltransferase [Clostridia bacterium]